MSKKIGFANYDSSSDQSEESKREEKQKEENKAIAEFISANYSPIGATPQKCYKTTAELVYDLNNIIAISPTILAKQLTAAGYCCEFLAGTPYWVMYEK